MLKFLKPSFILVILLGVIDLKAQTPGCYSDATNRFYYVSIGSNNWSGSTFATASATATCSTFSSGSYTGGNCLIEGTSSSNYRRATTNVIYPCPIDTYIFFFVIMIGGFSFIYLRYTQIIGFYPTKSEN